MSGGWRSRRERERELAEELESHFRLAIADRMQRGATREEALAAARREFGSELLVREVTRGMWPGARLQQVLQEVRISARTLLRTPRYSAAAAACIALGLGVTLTIFSALHAILLRPLPYAHAAELVVMRAHHPVRGETGATLSAEALDAWRGARTFPALATWREGTRDLTGPESVPERVPAAEVSPELFDLLGVAPRLGRGLRAEDATAGAAEVVLLGHELWRRRFGGDEGVVGARVELGGRSVEVVGVMPPGFSYPEGTSLWTPLVPPELPPGVLFYSGVLARLAPGATVAQAQSEFEARLERLHADGGYDGWRLELVSLRDDLLGALRRPVMIFQLAALLVLLLACANVAALLLARSAARRRELAVRAAIGADRGRLAAHVLVECGLIAAAGGVLGVGVAYVGVHLLTLAFPAGVPSYIDLALHPQLVAAHLMVALLAALAFGLPAAIGAGRTRAAGSLAGALRSDGGAGRRGRGRSALVVAEVAVSVVLFAGAMLLGRTYFALERGLGFHPEGVLSVTVGLPVRAYPQPAQRDAVYAQLHERLRALPGVTGVGAALAPVPLEDGPTAGRLAIQREGQPPPAGAEPAAATGQWIAPGFLGALGVTLVRGRDLTGDDAPDHSAGGGEIGALVNETFARRFFPGDDVLGQRVLAASAPGQPGNRVRIVGVVRDFRHAPPPAEIAPMLYMMQPPGTVAQTFVLSTALADPLVLAPAIRSAVREVDPVLIADRIQTQTSVVERTFWRQRLHRNVIGVFAGLALLLAVFGVYGVLSYAVAQRTAEFGVRLALGASARQLLGHVLADAARLAALGVLIGLGATLAAGRLLAGMLYGVEPADPLTLGTAAAALLATAIGAALAPAVRAARLDPQRALKS